MRHFRMFTLAVLVLTLPVVACAASPTTFKGLVDYLVSTMNLTVGIIVTAALVIYFFGIAQHMFKKEQLEGGWELRKFLFMGMIVIFVMVSVWGILEILRNTFEGRTGNIGEQGDANQQFCDAANFADCANVE